MKPGVYDLAAAAYHADPAEQPSLSSSIAKLLVNASPRHAFTAHPRLNPDFEQGGDAKFDLGTVFHAVFLEGRDVVEPLAFPDWRTNDAKALRAEARAAGKIPLLVEQWQEVQEMVAAVREQVPHLDVDPPMFTDGKPEQTVVWDEDGVTCRALVDWLRDDYSAVHDVKTTGVSANPESWKRTLYSIGADIQVAMNKRGVKAVTGIDPDFVFLVCETEPPYLVKPVRLAASALAVAEDKVGWALRMWKTCLASGEWPGYGPEVFEVEVPAWEEARWLEKTWVEAA